MVSVLRMIPIELLYAQANTSWIALTFCHFQTGIDSPGPIFTKEGSTPTDATLMAVTAHAHKKGLKVVWRPCVDLDRINNRAKGTWRGQIGRHFSDGEWEQVAKHIKSKHLHMQ